MIIGAIKEHNKNETRCALTPEVVKKLTQLGHKIILQKNIGKKSNFYDIEYKILEQFYMIRLMIFSLSVK